MFFCIHSLRRNPMIILDSNRYKPPKMIIEQPVRFRHLSESYFFVRFVDCNLLFTHSLATLFKPDFFMGCGISPIAPFAWLLRVPSFARPQRALREVYILCVP